MAAFIITKNVGKPGEYHYFAGYENVSDNQFIKNEPQWRMDPLKSEIFPTAAQAEVVRENLADKYKNFAYSLMEMEVKLTPIALNPVKTSHARSGGGIGGSDK